MIRLAAVIEAIRSHYLGPDDWLVGAEYAHAQQGSLNRIVAYPVNGTISQPDVAAQDWALSNLAPAAISGHAGARDSLIAARRPNVSFEIWAPDSATAESRLHALIVAINSIDNVETVTEEWPQANGAITSGGCMVILTCPLRIYVIASDREVIEDDSDAPAIGTGVSEAGPGGTVAIDAYQDSELIASYESEIET